MTTAFNVIVILTYSWAHFEQCRLREEMGLLSVMLLKFLLRQLIFLYIWVGKKHAWRSLRRC